MSVTLTLTDQIVIERSELPEMRLEITMNGTFVYPKAVSEFRWRVNEASAREARRQAMEYLAAAESLDRLLAEAARAEDAKQRRAEQKKLREEAVIFRNKLYPDDLDRLPPLAEDYWILMARTARELYGK